MDWANEQSRCVNTQIENPLDCANFLAAKAKVDENIRHKMMSQSWINSPFRNFEYACAQYDMKYESKTDSGTCNYKSTTTGWDIRDMLIARETKAMQDPYASWDYVTCTLSSKELRRVATWLDKRPSLKSSNKKDPF